MKKQLILAGFAFSLTLFMVSCKDDDGPFIELPATIQTYLDTNYPDAEIEESSQDSLCTGVAVYEVELEVSDDEAVDLTFGTEGGLLFTEHEIAVSEVPAAVTTAISASFSGYNTEEAERLDLAAGGTQYEVELKNSTQTLEVLFAADGTVICQAVEEDE